MTALLVAWLVIVQPSVDVWLLRERQLTRKCQARQAIPGRAEY
jgi:hypothetical protein